jgi:hypothetical protein
MSQLPVERLPLLHQLRLKFTDIFEHLDGRPTVATPGKEHACEEVMFDGHRVPYIMAAATPAATPEAYSFGCTLVAAFTKKLVAMFLPATSTLGCPSTVKARNGI